LQLDEIILRDLQNTGVVPLRFSTARSRAEKIEMKMKTHNLLITLSVAALAAVNVMATEALLSPRASEQQIRIAPGTNNDPNLAAARPTSVSPRVLDNQVKTVASKSDPVTPALDCARHMTGSPKIISACADHPGAPMPCCSVAAAK
jgi:hypothetical protein